MEGGLVSSVERIIEKRNSSPTNWIIEAEKGDPLFAQLKTLLSISS